MAWCWAYWTKTLASTSSARKSLVELARPLPVTFHRAFDASENLETSLEEVIQTGASRILTSGGQPRATDGLPILAQLVQAAKGRILIMPCGGIDYENVARIVQVTSAREIHTSVGASRLGFQRMAAMDWRSGAGCILLPPANPYV